MLVFAISGICPCPDYRRRKTRCRVFRRRIEWCTLYPVRLLDLDALCRADRRSGAQLWDVNAMLCIMVVKHEVSQN
jgi:hypothetical protein